MTSPHLGAQQESSLKQTKNSDHPGHPKVFSNSVSGTEVKNQILEEKGLIVLLSFKKLQEF